MTSFDRFERSLTELFDELASPRVPDYFDDLLTLTVATRQRPAWAIPERWFSMSVITRRFAAAPRIQWRLGAAVAMLALLAVLAVLAAGAILNRGPAPYGIAGNGMVAFVDAEGRLMSGNLQSGEASVLVASPGNSSPIYSQDGRRIAYFHAAHGGKSDLMVIDADGTESIRVSAEAILQPGYLGWSPDGRQLLVLDVSHQLLLYDVQQPGAPTVLSEAYDLRGVDIGLGYNHRSTAAFRPPAGDEIVVIASQDGGQALLALRPDGTARRTLIDPTTSSIPYFGIRGAEWSPDGTRLVVQLEFPDNPELWQTYVLNADGTDLRPVGDISLDPLIDQNSPLWSPDGTRVAFQYWTRHTTDGGQDFHPIAVVDVATGEYHDVGPTLLNGASWGWSPDGASIIEIPGDRAGAILVIDATTGKWETAPWTADETIDWQRVEP
jgi:Tol biopolymer transport system component